MALLAFSGARHSSITFSVYLCATLGNAALESRRMAATFAAFVGGYNTFCL